MKALELIRFPSIMKINPGDLVTKYAAVIDKLLTFCPAIYTSVVLLTVSVPLFTDYPVVDGGNINKLLLSHYLSIKY